MNPKNKEKKMPDKNLGASSQVEIAIGRVFSKMTHGDVMASQIRRGSKDTSASRSEQSNAPSMDAEYAIRKIKDHLKYIDRMGNIEKQIQDQFTPGFLNPSSARENQLIELVDAIPAKCLDLPVSENQTVRGLLEKLKVIALTDPLKEAIEKKLN